MICASVGLTADLLRMFYSRLKQLITLVDSNLCNDPNNYSPLLNHLSVSLGHKTDSGQLRSVYKSGWSSMQDRT